MTTHDYRYDFPMPLPAIRSRVFEALTDEQALRTWFAEHAQVEPREGGAYRFWGRHTMGTTRDSDADQVIVRYEPNALLAFRWRLLGRDSIVTLSLRDENPPGAKAEEPLTRLTVEHRFDALPDIGRAAELIDDLWRIHTGSLLAYLKGDDDIYRPDFGDASPRVRVEQIIDAPPATVFRVLTTPKYIGQWFPAPAPFVEPRVGGAYGFGMRYEQDGRTIEPPPCTILEYEQDRRLAISWPDWRGDPSVPDQKVTWILEDLDGRTRLVLLHDGFTRPVDVSDYPFGWGHFLREIGRVAEDVD